MKSHYLALIYNAVPNINKQLQKIKAPLKKKILSVIPSERVILTKDNIIKRNWHGSKQCCFCHKDETICHLFFECRLARMVWVAIHGNFGLAEPHSVAHIFGRGISADFKPLVLLGVAATCWSMWMDTNNLNFGNKQISFLQVIYKILRWLHT